MKVDVPGSLATSRLLFGETGGFVLEARREKIEDIKKIFSEHKLECFVIGNTANTGRIKINNVIDLPVTEARAAWENGLRINYYEYCRL